MKLKDHLQKNRADLNHKAPAVIWDKIDDVNSKAGDDTKSKMPKMFIALALVIVALSLGIWQYSEIQKKKKEIASLKIAMLELLEEQSVGKRIKAVTMSEQVKTSDQEIADVLLKTMTDDRSKNVRLAAINALSQFVDNENVRIAIIDHLAKATDPYIQIKLINILSEIKEKKAVPTLDNIVKDTKNVLVREKAKASSAYIKRT